MTTDDGRAALAGAAAAAVWAAAEPAARRVFRTPYSSVRLVGGVAPAARTPVGLAGHCAFGALFAVAFTRLGGRGAARGVLAAEVENLLLWPAMAAVDRFHPDRRAGRLPPLLRNGRVFAQEAAMHALFGALVGRFAARR